MMKFLSRLLVSITLIFSGTCAFAENIVWANSYQLEAVGKYSEAVAAIDSVPANGPDAEYKTLRRAWLFYLSGRHDESIREYRFALERNGSSVDAQLGITLPLLAAKRWREAEQRARAALEMSPKNYTAWLRLLIALEAQKNWEEMGKIAGMMVSAYPTDAAAYVYLARAAAWQNKTAAAIAAYLAVLARYPGHFEALTYLARK